MKGYIKVDEIYLINGIVLQINSKNEYIPQLTTELLRTSSEKTIMNVYNGFRDKNFKEIQWSRGYLEATRQRGLLMPIEITGGIQPAYKPSNSHLQFRDLSPEEYLDEQRKIMDSHTSRRERNFNEIINSAVGYNPLTTPPHSQSLGLTKSNIDIIRDGMTAYANEVANESLGVPTMTTDVALADIAKKLKATEEETKKPPAVAPAPAPAGGAPAGGLDVKIPEAKGPPEIKIPEEPKPPEEKDRPRFLTNIQMNALNRGQKYKSFKAIASTMTDAEWQSWITDGFREERFREYAQEYPRLSKKEKEFLDTLNIGDEGHKFASSESPEVAEDIDILEQPEEIESKFINRFLSEKDYKEAYEELSPEKKGETLDTLREMEEFSFQALAGESKLNQNNAMDMALENIQILLENIHGQKFMSKETSDSLKKLMYSVISRQEKWEALNRGKSNLSGKERKKLREIGEDFKTFEDRIKNGEIFAGSLRELTPTIKHDMSELEKIYQSAQRELGASYSP